MRERPLFVFSAGWRSGSTLLQRLLMSGGEHYLWGEPYARTDVVRRLGDSLLPISAEWPPADYLADPSADRADLARTWVANLYPPLEALVRAHRCFYTTMFASSLPESHDGGWGFKEVRLSIDYALYLSLLFPRARFVFLVRDPVRAYASYRSWRSWYDTWPAQVRTPRAYGAMWRRLAEGFRLGGSQVHSVLVRYEDLPVPSTVARLEDFLEVTLDPSVVDERIRGAAAERPEQVPALESRLLRRALGGAERSFGYGDPDGREPGRAR